MPLIGLINGIQDPTWRSRLKKDPGIPNLFPYKERILHEIEEARRVKEEEILKRRQKNKIPESLGNDHGGDEKMVVVGDDDTMMDEQVEGDEDGDVDMDDEVRFLPAPAT
ncbi:MAG: hypothetical protein M1823_005241 [Watsoniomyces obsoletus]|nr:MAG: hypothetical protein M1823_005241 [Watsoniomyces obsoletus]